MSSLRIYKNRNLGQSRKAERKSYGVFWFPSVLVLANVLVIPLRTFSIVSLALSCPGVKAVDGRMVDPLVDCSVCEGFVGCISKFLQ